MHFIAFSGRIQRIRRLCKRRLLAVARAWTGFHHAPAAAVIHSHQWNMVMLSFSKAVERPDIAAPGGAIITPTAPECALPNAADFSGIIRLSSA
jgi:hypothetical protein